MVTIQDKLSEVISSGKQLGASFVELRSLSIDRTMINLLDGKGKSIHGLDGGTAIRVLADGAWGFVSVVGTDLEAKTLKKGIKDACSLAKLAAAHTPEPVELYPVDPLQDVSKIKMQIDPREIPTSEKKDKLVNFHETIIKADERIRSSTISYADITGTHYYQNSDDVEITMDKCITWSMVIANGKEGSIRAGGREEFGSPYGYHIFNDAHLAEVADLLTQRVIRTLEAKPAKGGEFPAILSPPVAGVFAHEACGHLFEADLTENGCIGTALGQKIGSEYGTIVDDGIIENGIGSYSYDDEGIPAQRTVILDRGRVNALLTNREYAQKFQKINEKLESKIECTPSGNARAFDFRVPPIIRMRNTYFEAGDFSWDELLEPIKFGYWFVHFRGGEASLEGTFTVGIQEAYEIVNGEIGDPVRGASISGNTLETLHSISGASKANDFLMHPGRCGKGQTAFTGDGGTRLRVDKINVAGEE
ncbi:MAG: metallopeptidase TldD-related protein [Candidatus Hodarchaeota archaeon]